MRNRCARTLSLLSVIVFIGLSSSMAAEIPVVRGQLQLAGSANWFRDCS